MNKIFDSSNIDKYLTILLEYGTPSFHFNAYGDGLRIVLNTPKYTNQISLDSNMLWNQESLEKFISKVNSLNHTIQETILMEKDKKDPDEGSWGGVSLSSEVKDEY